MDLPEAGASAALVASLGERGVVVDALVNNAGFSTYGEFWRDDPATQLGHVAGQRRRAHRAEPPDRARAWSSGAAAGSCNLGSVGSFGAGADDRRLRCDQGLRALALARHGRRATRYQRHRDVPVPGPTRTGFQDRAGDARLCPDPRARSFPSARRGRRGGVRGDEGGYAVPGDRRQQQAVRVRFSLPAAHDDRAHRGPLPTPTS